MKEQKKICPIPLPDSFWEQRKNELLVALYEKNYSMAEHLYLDICKQADRLSHFTENAEKLLNQIQTLFKKFRPKILNHCTPQIKIVNQKLKHLLSNQIHKAKDNTQYIDFQTWDKRLGLNQCQKDLVYKTAMTFQLTSGCSNFCRRCNEWALPGVRSHFSYESILEILSRMKEQKNKEISLYGASDPLDWTQEGKTIADIIEILETMPIDYSLLTKVPKGKTALFKRLLKSKSNLSVSLTTKNKTRIKMIEQEINATISKQHDLEDLLIPARLDEDFETIKPSITDGYGTEITPDGAFIIIPTFTSALHPFGHQKIPVTQESDFFPVKKTGRNALLVDYFKPLEGYDAKGRHCNLTHLLDIQTESILLDNGTDELTPPGMRSIKEYLSIFEEKARRQRKKMTPIVLKKIKNQGLSNTSFKNLSQKSRTIYLKKIQNQQNLCNPATCLSSKLATISFFLESISRYIRKNPVKIKMIQFLLKDEIKAIFHNQTRIISDRSPEILLEDTRMDSFDIFRYYVFCLLCKPENDTLFLFMKAYPSAYDPVADMFILY